MIMGIQNKNMKNSIKSRTYHKSKTLFEFEKLDIDWVAYCQKAKNTVHLAEENICRLIQS